MPSFCREIRHIKGADISCHLAPELLITFVPVKVSALPSLASVYKQFPDLFILDYFTFLKHIFYSYFVLCIIY